LQNKSADATKVDWKLDQQAADTRTGLTNEMFVQATHKNGESFTVRYLQL
jgi:hypothetical protein